VKTKDVIELEKHRAALVAASYVKDGMRVGLGSGSTMVYLVKRLGERIRNEGLKIAGVPTSSGTHQLAVECGIPLIEPTRGLRLDLTIDGADEIGPNLSLIKGGGAALFREKLIASASERVAIVGDSSKIVTVLGAFPLPVEVVPFATPWVMDRIANLDGAPVLRHRKDRPDEPTITDQGNWILDCHFKQIPDPAGLASQLSQICGILEHGLFIGLANVAIVVDGDTVSITQDYGATQNVPVSSYLATP
jgi:ribose 5-phosphate isomerase A